MTGVGRIAKERARQIEEEGWTPDHDDEHCFGELSGAGASFAEVASRHLATGVAMEDMNPTQVWRFPRDWWKPTNDPVRALEKAGALIAAEIDRILRERQAD